MAKNKNKKRDAQPGVFPGALAVVLACAIGIALAYLWVDGRCDAMGRRIKQLEQQKEALIRARINEEFQWSNMTSPQNMEKLLRSHNLVMSWPSEQNVVRVHRRLGDESSSATLVLAQGKGEWAHD